MKIKTRLNVFETNSSSIHSISIYNRKENLNIPNKVILIRQLFGWETKDNYDVEDRLNYFFEMCIRADWYHNRLELEEIDNEYGEEKIIGFDDDSSIILYIEYLKEKGIEVEYFLGAVDDGEIDHGYKWEDFERELLNEPDILDKFLFGDKSLLITGNDNEYMEDSFYKDYFGSDYSVHYKGN